MRSLTLLGFAALVFAPSCTNTADSGDSAFEYGRGHPGVDLPEGGGVYHDNIRALGTPAQATISVYQFTTPSNVPNAPFAWPLAPASFEASPDTQPQWGNCVDERTAQTWPFAPISEATFLMLSQVELSGAGITGTIDLPLASTSNVSVGFGRQVGIAYGSTDTVGDPQNFAPTVAMATPDSDYTIDIGEGDPMTYHMPSAYTPPLGIGGADTVMIPAGQDLEMTWAAPANDKGADGTVHTRSTYFNYTLFADPTAASPLQFICFDDVDGHQLIPAAVLALVPANGLILQSNYSHYMEARDDRRFDLYSSYTSYSQYVIR